MRAMEAQASEPTTAAGRRLRAARREGERVMPLELFFDLVFVLALTQCTALMVANPTWEGIGQAMLVLALLWWSWTAYAWLTSVVDPEEGAVRLALVAAMAALLIAALAVPQAFGDMALEFALAYGAVRAAHIGLFVVASRDDPALRRSITGLAVGTGLGVALLIAGALAGGTAQAILWVLALVLDIGEPYFFGSEGWRLVPGHFAERHGLIIIVALGETIVALGVGSDVGLTREVTLSAILGIVLVFELWWIYFDVVAIANVRRLVRAPLGRAQNELARDAYSYLHYPLVAGIVLAALGLHDVLAHPEDALKTVPAFALVGGVGIYLLGHVAVRWRGAHTLNRHRLVLGAALCALTPVATEVSGLAALGFVAAVLAAMIAYETRGYGSERNRFRHGFAAKGPEAQPTAGERPAAGN
jgi:low temperature requirement protein LtrA